VKVFLNYNLVYMNQEMSPLNDKEEVKRLKIQLELEKEHIEQLEKLLNHDPDTGLLQKHVLIQRMRRFIKQKPMGFAYAIIRLDRSYQRIKYTRDRMKVLLYVTSERIKEIVGEKNLYQSDRSDEFLIILPGITNKEKIKRIITRITQKIKEYHNPPASDITFGCHVGVAVFPDHAQQLEDLQINTEIALGIYEHKREQGFIYSPEIGEIYHQKEALESILLKCVQQGFQGFHLVYQPIVNSQNKILGCEALLRWDAPGHGAVPPTQFIPMAEHSGSIHFLGHWVLYHAMNQVKTWRHEMGMDIFVSINVSPIQLESQKFVGIVRDILESLELPGEAIHLEVTESSVMEEPDMIIDKLKQLQSLGIRIMLDDFGTGYSSLSYLNQFPIDTLKIPKEFIDDFPNNPQSMDMVRAILSLARNFGFNTLAEGVELKEQFDSLIAEGCKYIQGFLFSRPIDATDLEELFQKQKSETQPEP
jgi:EAL domain-containing protein (putative c-di-GMP-specific phosphodiesterase class I)/GGDEF domain-containing protein